MSCWIPPVWKSPYQIPLWGVNFPMCGQIQFWSKVQATHTKLNQHLMLLSCLMCSLLLLLLFLLLFLVCHQSFVPYDSCMQIFTLSLLHCMHLHDACRCDRQHRHQEPHSGLVHPPWPWKSSSTWGKKFTAITCTYASSTDKQENSSSNNTLKLGCSGRSASSRNHLFPHLGNSSSSVSSFDALHCTSSSLWTLPDKRTTHKKQTRLSWTNTIPAAVRIRVRAALRVRVSCLLQTTRQPWEKMCKMRAMSKIWQQWERMCKMQAVSKIWQRLPKMCKMRGATGIQIWIWRWYGGLIQCINYSVSGIHCPKSYARFLLSLSLSLCVILIPSSQNLNGCEGMWTRDIGDVNLRNLMNIAWQFWYADWPLIQEMAQEDGFLSMMS